MTVWMPEHGRVVPRGGRLVVALAAGVLCLLALRVLVAVPGQVRFAHLYAQWAHEGIGWFPVLVSWTAIGLLVGLAYVLSVVAHGVGRGAPRLVRATRGAVLLVVAAGCTGPVLVAVAVGDGCFRTCAPFPQ